MLVVLIVFLAVFLCRDVQVLAMQRPPQFASRFAVYCALQLGAIAFFAEALSVNRYDASKGWLAWTAIAIQVAELGIALVLTRVADGRHSWIGWVLPPPALSAALLGMSTVIQTTLLKTESEVITLLVPGLWFCLIGAFAFLLNRLERVSDDRKFVAEFALLTSCTALVFVPLGML